MQQDTEFNLPKKHAHRRRIAESLVAALLVFLAPMLEEARILRGPYSLAMLFAGLALGGYVVAKLIGAMRFERGQVTVDQEGVRLGDQRIPRAAIRSAWFGPGAGRLRSAVRLVGENERQLGQIAVTSETEATAILDALELGPQQRAARFSAFAPRGSTAARASWGMFGLGVLPIVGMFLFGAPWLIAVSFLLWVLASAVFVPCTVHVGADGLLIGTRIAPSFIPWSEVVAVEPYARGVRIRRNEDVITLPMAGQVANDYDRVLLQGLVARAAQSLAAYRQGAHPDAAARVARRGRPHAEWLRDLFDREGGFRTAPLLDDQLWSVVESPTAEATARAGAAAVLARTAGDAERSRLRIAADGCTAPRLRVALEKAASGASETEVEDALLDLDDESAAAVTR